MICTFALWIVYNKGYFYKSILLWIYLLCECGKAQKTWVGFKPKTLGSQVMCANHLLVPRGKIAHLSSSFQKYIVMLWTGCRKWGFNGPTCSPTLNLPAKVSPRKTLQCNTFLYVLILYQIQKGITTKVIVRTKSWQFANSLLRANNCIANEKGLHAVFQGHFEEVVLMWKKKEHLLDNSSKKRRDGEDEKLY